MIASLWIEFFQRIFVVALSYSLLGGFVKFTSLDEIAILVVFGVINCKCNDLAVVIEDKIFRIWHLASSYDLSIDGKGKAACNSGFALSPIPALRLLLAGFDVRNLLGAAIIVLRISVLGPGWRIGAFLYLFDGLV